jgi:hypothetical protein
MAIPSSFIFPLFFGNRYALQGGWLLSTFYRFIVKYTPEGGPVSVKLWRENGLARLRGADNGIGIPTEAAAGMIE